MKNKIFILVGLVLSLFSAPLYAAAAEMRPGLWEITMTMEMPGMPYAMPPTTHTQCVKPEDNKSAIPAEKSDECQIVDNKVSGNKMTWKMKCKNGTTGIGEITHKADSYDGSMKMTTQSEGQKQQITMRYKGRRIGDCK